MCSLCGILGGNEHWTDAVARPGTFTRNHEPVDRRRERANRVKAANVVLAFYSLQLTDWQGASFQLSSRTGKTELVKDLGQLWQVAERMLGRDCDPLDEGIIMRLELGHMAEIPRFTTINLLTGFLGSGKTTLLSRLLKHPSLANAAVLINEFGEVGLDHHLVERLDDNIVLLQSGCICCTVRGDLAEAIRDLHSRRERGEIPPFQRVIIESTGLADPFPILSTFKADPVLRHHFRAGAVIATVDAVNGEQHLDTYIESNRQAAIADRLVITKSDLAGADELAKLVARLEAISPDAPISMLQGHNLDLASLLDEERPPRGAILQSTSGFYCDMPRHLVDTDGRAHTADFKSLVLEIDMPVDWTAFGIWLTMLLNRHGSRILRVKGILNLLGEDRPVAIHGVQHLVHEPVHMESWGSRDRLSRLVFIVDGINTSLLRRSFDAFAIPATTAG